MRSTLVNESFRRYGFKLVERSSTEAQDKLSHLPNPYGRYKRIHTTREFSAATSRLQAAQIRLNFSTPGTADSSNQSGSPDPDSRRSATFPVRNQEPRPFWASAFSEYLRTSPPPSDPMKLYVV
jgi:hypothetical protein